MKIYKYLSEEVKNEINKSIKSKLNAEDVKAWREDIVDIYVMTMCAECWNMIYNDPQYDLGYDRIRELAEDIAEHNIDQFIKYCIDNDYDPYERCIDNWIDDIYGGRPICVFDDTNTIEDMIMGGYIVKK